MLPKQLVGPKSSIFFAEDAAEFIKENSKKFPLLDKDFISQICFEHPDRFDWYFPKFDVRKFSAFRIEKTMGWVADKVRYDDNEAVDWWSENFDYNQEGGNLFSQHDLVYTHMIANKSWPFPPVIISNKLAKKIGNRNVDFGAPYHLIEGTHRVSYARRMLELGMIPSEQKCVIIEIASIASA